MPLAKILLVDDDDVIRHNLAKILDSYGFEITTAANVPDALRNITSENYDVLLSDLQMPGAGDGLTLVSAMRHANPRAVTLLLSGFPKMKAATDAILRQADEILVKPVQVGALVELIKQRLTGAPRTERLVQTAATILERSAEVTIREWYGLVRQDEGLNAASGLSYEQRTGYLHQMFRDLVRRLRLLEPLGSKLHESRAAKAHGIERARQGYTAAMIVEESRCLQVSIFRTLQNNLMTIDFSLVLADVMTIADEVDSQLAQAMVSFVAHGSSRAAGAMAEA